MRTILITVGLPGSGKTTYSKELLKKELGRWKRINRDDLRMMNDNRLFIKGDHEREKFVTKESDALMREAFGAGYDIIIDNLNLSGKFRKDIHKFAERWGDVTVIEKVFEVPLKTVLQQNAGREGERCVPEDAILDMAKRYFVGKDGKFGKIKDNTTYYPPVTAKGNEVLEQDPSLPGAIICDLDGTLALLGDRNPYDASRCADDILNVPVAMVLAAFAKQKKILFMSGRQDKFRPQTLEFFQKNIPELEYEGLFMRRTGDMRKDSLVKREMFDENVRDKYFVHFVIDDRPQVVRMWRHELGLTVFQLDDREF